MQLTAETLGDDHGEGEKMVFAIGFPVANTGTCGCTTYHNGEQKERMSTRSQGNHIHFRLFCLSGSSQTLTSLP